MMCLKKKNLFVLKAGHKCLFECPTYKNDETVKKVKEKREKTLKNTRTYRKNPANLALYYRKFCQWCRGIESFEEKSDSEVKLLFAIYEAAGGNTATADRAYRISQTAFIADKFFDSAQGVQGRQKLSEC